MRTVAKSFAVACGFMLAGTALQAQTNVVSDPVGFYKVPIVPGANFISAPMQPIQAFRGLVSGVAGNVVTLSGAAFTASAFNQINLGTDAGTFTQYILVVKNDADKSPGATNNITGDWAQVVSNGTNSVTVSAAQGLAPLLGVGDQVEVRRLSSLKDLFGTGSTVILNQDGDGSQNTATCDVIRYVTGTAFTKAVSYYNDGAGTQGYIIGADGPFDGSTITIEPDEPLMFFRKAGTGTTNMVSLGQVQTTRLTHYLSSGSTIASGANTFANVFPANAPLGASNLGQTPGFALDPDGSQAAGLCDVVRAVTGTSFTAAYSYLDPSLNGGNSAWLIDGGSVDDTFPLNPGKGYIIFVKPNTGTRVWRQNVPFTP